MVDSVSIKDIKMKKDGPSSEVGHHHKTEPEGEAPSCLPSEAPEKGKPRIPTNWRIQKDWTYDTQRKFKSQIIKTIIIEHKTCQCQAYISTKLWSPQAVGHPLDLKCYHEECESTVM